MDVGPANTPDDGIEDDMLVAAFDESVLLHENQSFREMADRWSARQEVTTEFFENNAGLRSQVAAFLAGRLGVEKYRSCLQVCAHTHTDSEAHAYSVLVRTRLTLILSLLRAN